MFSFKEIGRYRWTGLGAEIVPKLDHIEPVPHETEELLIGGNFRSIEL
jgi:hypothetical protein